MQNGKKQLVLNEVNIVSKGKKRKTTRKKRAEHSSESDGNTKKVSKKKVNGSALNSIVFVSSNISNRGAKAMAAYGASKGAVDSLMRCLAVELAPKVRVNSVLPGAVHTEMTEGIFANLRFLLCKCGPGTQGPGTILSSKSVRT